MAFRPALTRTACGISTGADPDRLWHSDWRDSWRLWKPGQDRLARLVVRPEPFPIGGKAPAEQSIPPSEPTLDSPALLWYLKLRSATEVKLPLEMKKPAEVRRVASALVEAPRDHGACFPIGVVADLLGVTEQTHRLF